jgi:hypothetical protein
LARSEHAGQIELEGNVRGGFRDAEQRAERDAPDLLLADARDVVEFLCAPRCNNPRVRKASRTVSP